MTTLLFAQELTKPARPARCDCGSSRFEWREESRFEAAGWECLDCGEVYEVETEQLETMEGGL